MKRIILAVQTALAIFGGSAFAVTTAADLAAHCGGEYEVLSVGTPAFRPAFGRAPAFASVDAQIEVLDADGGCPVTANRYHTKMPEKGMILSQTFSLSPEGNLAGQAQGLVGSVKTFSLVQTFDYVNQAGELPLFPMAHRESLAVTVGPEGKFGGPVDVKAIYGVTPLSELGEKEKAQILDITFQQIKAMEKDPTLSQMVEVYPAKFLELALTVIPTLSVRYKIYYLTNLLDLFDAISENAGFTSANQDVRIGGVINSLNQAPGVSSGLKVDILVHHPLLFDNQIATWGCSALFHCGPVVSADELEAFLEKVAPEMQIPITNWNLQHREVVRKYQIRDAAQGIGGDKFTLTPKAKALLAQILSVNP